MKHMYIHTLATEKWAVVTEGRDIVDLVVERPSKASLVGNIYQARVINVEKSLDAGFVDYGEEKFGFLKRTEIPEARQHGLPIEKAVHEGQALWVQVTKDAYDSKGAQVTANVTLPGRNMVYLPFGGYVAMSRKFQQEEREQLTSIFNEKLGDGEGLIVRTSAKDRDEDALLNELQQLRKDWEEITSTPNKKPPFIVYEDNEIPNRLLSRYRPEEIEGIFVDEAEIKQAIVSKYSEFPTPVLQSELEASLPISFTAIRERIVQRNVPLKNGAELIIDRTEAMTVMDVNTAKRTKTAHKGMNTLETNRLAATEAARQIRLRNLSGIIVIDFIDMKNEQERAQVIHTMKQELRKDRIRTEVYGFTRLGILELTRKRESVSLPLLFLEEWNSTVSAESHAYDWERELWSYRRNDQDVMLYEARPDVVEAFHNSIDLKKLQSHLYKEVYVLNNRESDVPYRIRYVGNKDSMKERPFYSDSAVDRML
ncbi:hypothetical protein N781_10655 [Pontibacillus halophilus JSM 076056 = DSM 19796]|uniref:RNA-binding protein AU-1/Ribonuclease E/G domain-containing protein n=1 Tax=Pontibacillus halophilus JSM 076056 = DSM 19796 TaxID=1385510 RepID=A0A0A5GR44_9BACI|nr:Rne/Rng family ribonuclease [Pontibacillus halophilus]KGX93630.1 hypothetical protein N781_10655 [Pontibacillus halophilus JSM 076056 = DSM 19796]